MGRVCEICGRRPRAGNKVSHSNRKSRRFWKPNVAKLFVEYEGAKRRMYVCMKCLKRGKVKKVIKAGNIENVNERV